MPHHEKMEHRPEDMEAREKVCHCSEGKECSCGDGCKCGCHGHCCGKKIWLKILAAVIIFLAGYGFACCCHCCGAKHHKMMPPAYGMAGENGGTMIVINTDGSAAMHSMRKGKHHCHHINGAPMGNAVNTAETPVETTETAE